MEGMGKWPQTPFLLRCISSPAIGFVDAVAVDSVVAVVAVVAAVAIVAVVAVVAVLAVASVGTVVGVALMAFAAVKTAAVIQLSLKAVTVAAT
jgi:hypothetical protein